MATGAGWREVPLPYGTLKGNMIKLPLLAFVIARLHRGYKATLLSAIDCTAQAQACQP